MPYGKELILDLHDCNPEMFNRVSITRFYRKLCEAINVEPADLHFWDDVGVPPEECQTEPHLKGTSAVQFILTSTIVVHSLDLLGKVFINIFSCDSFNTETATEICREWFQGRVAQKHTIDRM